MSFEREYWVGTAGVQEGRGGEGAKGQRSRGAVLGKGRARVQLVRAVVRCAEAHAEEAEAKHEDSEPCRRSPQGGLSARD